MPELPEVETSRRHVEKATKKKRIVEVFVDTDDHIVYDQAKPEAVRDALDGARVVGTGRKGKYFWLELDRKPWPVFHLGMSGNVEIKGKRGRFKRAWGGEGLWQDSKRAKIDANFLPFCRIRFTMDDGTEIAITDPRRFGRIRLAQNPLEEAPISKLGYDPLIDFPSAKDLEKILKRRKAPIKAILLDQGLFAGVGNWIADEVLFQARLSPKRLGATLTATEVKQLRQKLLSIIKVSVGVNADYDEYPTSWLFHHRWGKVKDAKTSKKMKIVHDTIGGRTTAWVPEIQK